MYGLGAIGAVSPCNKKDVIILPAPKQLADFGQ